MVMYYLDALTGPCGSGKATSWCRPSLDIQTLSGDLLFFIRQVFTVFAVADVC